MCIKVRAYSTKNYEGLKNIGFLARINMFYYPNCFMIVFVKFYFTNDKLIRRIIIYLQNVPLDVGPSWVFKYFFPMLKAWFVRF